MLPPRGSKLTWALQNPSHQQADSSFAPFFLADRKDLWAWGYSGLCPLTARSSYRRWDLHPFILIRVQGPRPSRVKCYHRQLDIRKEAKEMSLLGWGAGACLLAPPRINTLPFPHQDCLRDQGEVSTSKYKWKRLKGRCLTIEACQPTLGKVRGCTHLKPSTAWKVDRLF